MNGNSPIKEKSRAFAIRIIHLYSYMAHSRNEYVLSKQILRSGTGIGANIAESACAISKKDFLSKIYIALKECNETLYWLDLLHETGYITDKAFVSLNNDCLELKKMLTATTKTTVKNLNPSDSSNPV